MKINWKVRFRNPVWLTAFVAFIVSTVYGLLLQFDIVPTITEDAIMAVVTSAVQLLTLMGILVDPTTAGISDSEQAMSYPEPYGQKE